MADTRGRAGWLRRRRRGERGASAVEFAIVLPVLCLFLYGIIEFGGLWMIKHGLTEATADAARGAATTTPANASSVALAQLSSSVKNDVSGLITAGCNDGTGALTCTATVAQCPNEPTGFSCLTVQVYYAYSKNPVLPDLLGLAPNVSASSTVMLTGGLS